VHRLGLA